MYNIKVDAHTHTLYTKHAFSTIKENAQVAAEKGLEAIAQTDHFGLWIPGFHKNRPYEPENHIKGSNLPSEICGIRVFKGIEMDIIDISGSLAGSDIVPGYLGYKNFADYVLNTKEVVIAALHYFPNMRDYSIVQNTQMYINVLETKGVHILGHPNRAGLGYDIKEIVLMAKYCNKMLEINEETLKSRPEVQPLCQKLAEACAEAGVSICVNSDAHFCDNIGELSRAFKMLQEINFPVELIANRSLATFTEALSKANG